MAPWSWYSAVMLGGRGSAVLARKEANGKYIEKLFEGRPEAAYVWDRALPDIWDCIS